MIIKKFLHYLMPYIKGKNFCFDLFSINLSWWNQKLIWGKSFGRSVKGYLEVILLHFSFAFYCTVTKNRGVVPAGFLCTFYGILEVRFLPKQFVTTIKKVHRSTKTRKRHLQKMWIFFSCIKTIFIWLPVL